MKIKIRIFLYSTLFLTITWLVIQSVVPFGKITYLSNFKKNNYFIYKPKPLERVIEENDSIKLIGNPVYFSVYMPRNFDEAKISFKYRNNNQNIKTMEAGFLLDKNSWRYDLKPLENKTIDNLKNNWTSLEKDGLILWQRKSNYQTIKNFLDNLPEKNEIALYNYNLKNNYQENNYIAQNNKQNIINNLELKGGYEFYTYIKKEDLFFSFFLENSSNLNEKITINCYNLNNQTKKSLTANLNKKLNIDLFLENLNEGAYKIEIKATDNIITKKIITPQQKFSLINKFKLNELNTKIPALYTDGQKISLETTNPKSLQTVLINNEKLSLKNTFKLFEQTLSSKETKIILEKSDLMLATNSVFYLNKTAYINPEFKKLTNLNDLKDINYIVTTYQSPKEDHDWKIAEIKVKVNNVFKEKNRETIMLSIPDLKNTGNEFIELKEIKIEYSGATLLNKIKKIIKKYI